MRILVVEDERKLAQALASALKAEHYEVVLGLAIAKCAVEIHGGRITVHEPRGGGSEFRIHLPLAESPPALQQRALPRDATAA